MKAVFNIIPVFMLVPFLGLAQVHNAKKADFYLKLGFKDAIYEQTMGNISHEDEVDFWRDQKSFERQLQQKDAVAYQNYLNGKHIAYGQHHKNCDESCGHSDLYLRQASFYAVNGSFALDEDFAISSKKVLQAKKMD